MTLDHVGTPELYQIHYTVAPEVRFLEDHGEYHTYGLLATQQSPEGRLKATIGDITTDIAAAQSLAAKFNSNKLSIVHFMDAVEDWLLR